MTNMLVSIDRLIRVTCCCKQAKTVMRFSEKVLVQVARDLTVSLVIKVSIVESYIGQRTIITLAPLVCGPSGEDHLHFIARKLLSYPDKLMLFWSATSFCVQKFRGGGGETLQRRFYCSFDNWFQTINMNSMFFSLQCLPLHSTKRSQSSNSCAKFWIFASVTYRSSGGLSQILNELNSPKKSKVWHLYVYPVVSAFQN